mmetsp:Transcript_80815/g.148080  ORF Transcript_80815/g.148080 Transcript_80815/m.148080 type:complete len:897 (+) Transcript_80815:23-2713(+)
MEGSDIQPLCVEEILRTLDKMFVDKKQPLETCCAIMRKWGRKEQVTPQKKVILLTNVEAALQKWPPAVNARQPADVAPPSVVAKPAGEACAPPQQLQAASPREVAAPAEIAPSTASGSREPQGLGTIDPGHCAEEVRTSPQQLQSERAQDVKPPSENSGRGKKRNGTAPEAAAPKIGKRQRAAEEKQKRLQEEAEERERQEREAREKAKPYEGLSLEEMREKRLDEVLLEMDNRMYGIARRAAEMLGNEPPSEHAVSQACMGSSRREAYMQLVHTRQERIPVPAHLKAELMPYQVEGLEWLGSIYVNQLHGILADEMGLGKTIQSIALLLHLKEVRGNRGPHLIIAPKSTLSNWQEEFKRFAPSYKVFLLIGEMEERERLSRKLLKRIKRGKTATFITNYEQIHRNEWLMNVDWQLIMIDEGHRMKNPKSVLHETMKKINCRTRLLLTGTPLQNNLNELWALLHYLLPDLFPTAMDFQSWFLDPMAGIEGFNEYLVQLRPEDEESIIGRLHTMLAPFLLQRTKAQVMEDKLPPKVEATVRVELSAWQQRAYSDLQQRTIKLLTGENQVAHQKINNVLMQLRKIVLHPYLFVSEFQENEELYRTSGKLEVLDRMLPKLIRFQHRILIFSQFTSALDVLDTYLSWKGIAHCRIDGQTPHEQRRKRISEFNSVESGFHVFLLSARAAGLGLNLQAADTVVLFDMDWNPQNDKQAVARAHRVGQTREVRVFRLISDSAVERHMEQRCKEKLELEKKVIGAGMFHRGACQDQRRDLLRSALGLVDCPGAASEASAPAAAAEGAVTSPEELNQLLARSDEELLEFNAMDRSILNSGTQTASTQEDASALVKCGRLMRQDEVPDGFRLNEEDEDAEQDDEDMPAQAEEEDEAEGAEEEAEGGA